MTMNKEQIIEQYLLGVNLGKLSEECKISKYKIRQMVENDGLNLRKTGGRFKYSFDVSYFDNIDTEKKAYWLGFIYAEGNLYKNTLAIKLSSIDKERLVSFLQDIKSNHPIKSVKDKMAYVIKISSKSLRYQMNRLGIFPNKSSSIKFPDIDDSLVKHFIRGFLDGDGWISCTIKRSMLGFSSCSYEFLWKIKIYFDTTFNRNFGSIFQRKKIGNHQDSFQLAYSNRDAEIIASHIYESGTEYLDRKYKKYMELIDRNQSKLRKKVSKFNGVCPDGTKWKSYVQYKKAKVILGFFNTEIEAALRYNAFIIEHNINIDKLNLCTN